MHRLSIRKLNRVSRFHLSSTIVDPVPELLNRAARRASPSTDECIASVKIVTIDASQIHSDGSTFVNDMDWPGLVTVRIGASQLAGGDIITATSRVTFTCAGVYDENYVLSLGCP